jgi:hypothetical protein
MTIAPAAAIAQLPVTRTSSPVSWVITPADLTESTDAPQALPTGGVRRKSNTTPGWTATAVSSQVIYQDGEITFTAPTGQVLAVGLSLYNTGPSPSDLEHSIRFSASKATIYFGATLGPSLGTYTPTTKFTIRRKSNLQIEYLVDGQLKHTTSTIVVGRLQADCSLNTAGAQITSCSIDQGDSDADGLPDAWQIAYFPAFPNYANIWPFDSDANADGDPANNLREFLDGSHPRNPLSYLNPVTWAAPVVGAELPDSLGSIRKTSTSLTWDVSATSKDANTLEEHTLIEDGKLTFRAVRPPSSTTVTPLLAVGFFPATNLVNTTSSLADLPYAIILSSNGTAAARRPGTTTNTSLGEFNSETSFSIERVNGIVTFIKDGVASSVPNTPLLSGPLHIKCRLYKPGAELTECRLYTGDIDLDKLPDAWETTYLTPASPDSGPTLIDLQNFLPSSPSPLTPDPADPDLDSLNNFQEFRDGTHPLRQLLTSADVLWLAQPASNVTFPSPTTITKATGTPVAWDTDAIALYAPGSTSPLLLQESGKLAFSVSSGSHLAVGLTFQNNSRAFGDLEYSIIVTPQGTAAVYSGTTNVKSLGRYNSNTRFIIRRLGGRIDFLSDNIVLHSVLLPTAKRTLPLIVDSSFRTPGSSIVEARLYTGDLDEDGLPDTWEITHLRRLNQGDPDFAALDGFSPEMDSDTDTVSNAIEFNAGTDPLQPLSKPQPIAWTVFAKTFNPFAPANTTGTLRKISRPTPTTSATWNADAISTQTLPSDGSVTFTASPTGNLAVGLTYQNTLRTVADLEYAFVLTPTTTTTVGTAAIRRPETTNLATGPYTSSTVFTFRRASNVISFLRDGVTLYTSTVPTAAGSQFVDCAILQFDHQIDSAYIHDAAQDLDGDSIPDAWELAILPPNSNLTALQNDFAPYGDYDKDGLTNAREFQLGTDPTRSDTDGDGLPDAWEVDHGSNPNESDAFADADGDGISNQAEKKASETTTPGPTYIFTSERIKTGSFDGEAGHKKYTVTEQTNGPAYWVVDEDNPAYLRWLSDRSDGLNGDADDQNNNTDPGDPRDEYVALKPPPKYIQTQVEEGTQDSYETSDLEDVDIYENLHEFDPPRGVYASDNGILPVASANAPTDSENASFNSTTLNHRILSVDWGRNDDLHHGWRGDGKAGTQPKNAHAQWNTSSATFDFGGETYTYHTTNASAKHIQVRLQSSKPITDPEGLSRSFILVKTTTDLTPGNTTPPVQQFIGTVILTIPEGKTISASAGGTAGPTYLKHEQDIAYVELRPTTFTENKRIDLDLLPIEAMQPTINSDGTAGSLANVAAVRMCRWESPRNQYGPLQSRAEFPKDDPDRFVIRLPLGHRDGTTIINVQVSTVGATDSNYNDSQHEVEFTEEGSSGIFVSKPMALVVDSGDDDLSVGGAAEGALNDPTFIAQPGGKIRLSCTELGNTPIEISIKRYSHRLRHIQVFAGDAIGEDGLVAYTQNRIRFPEIYNQIHLRTDEEHGTLTLSSSELGTIYANNQLTDEGLGSLIAKVDSLGVPNSIVKFIWIPTSITPIISGSEMGAINGINKRKDIVFLFLRNLAQTPVTSRERSQTMAHELGHSLRGPDHREFGLSGPYLPNHHLMANGGGNPIRDSDPDASGKHWYVRESETVKTAPSEPISP